MKLRQWLKYIVKNILVPLAITVLGGVLVYYVTMNTPKNHPGSNQGGSDVTVIINGNINVYK